jgi:tetratricopeptide (TPR) repeat protein
LQWRAAVSGSLDKIGDVLSAQGDLDNALIAYREGMEDLREITAKDASQPILQRNLSVALNKVGNVLWKKGDPTGALVLRRESLDILRAVAVKDPSNTLWQRDEAATLEGIADVLATQGDLVGALATSREQVDISRALTTKNPDDAGGRRALGVGLNKIGIVLRSQGDLTGAVAAHRESLDIARELATKDPSNAQWQMDVFYSLDDLANAGDDPRGRWGDALAILARLKSQGALPPSRQGWIGKINSALAALPDANLAVSSIAAQKSVALEQIDGTYDGINEDSQTNGKAQFSLTFQRSGNDVAATYRSALGAHGRGSGTINGNAIYMMPFQSETPNCPGSYIASFKFEGDNVIWTYTGQDCNGPAQGRGSAKYSGGERR